MSEVDFSKKLEDAINAHDIETVKLVASISDINDMKIGDDGVHPLLFVARQAKTGDVVDNEFTMKVVEELLKSGVDMIAPAGDKLTNSLASEVLGEQAFDIETTQLILAHGFYQATRRIGIEPEDIIRAASGIIAHNNKNITADEFAVSNSFQPLKDAISDLQYSLHDMTNVIEGRAVLDLLEAGQINADNLIKIVEAHELELGGMVYKNEFGRFATPNDKIIKKDNNNEKIEKDLRNKTIPADSTIIKDDIDVAKLIIAEMQEKYVGQDGPINQAKTLLARAQFDKATGNNNSRKSMHMRFEGNPGTLKTTMAREYSELLHALGISNGKFIELTREKLVGGHIGETEQIVSEFIDEAMGGVLFIDEVHNLVTETNSSNRRDYGYRVIEALVGAMERHREELTVIVAGYSGDIERFLSADSGLRDRFTKTVKFEDYDENALSAIMDVHLKQNNLVMPEDVKKRAVDGILEYKAKLGNREFGNGRVVRNLVEQLPDAMAMRIFSSDNIDASNMSEEELKVVHVEDVEAHIEKLLSSAEGAIKIREASKDDSYGRTKIGFTAQLT